MKKDKIYTFLLFVILLSSTIRLNAQCVTTLSLIPSKTKACKAEPITFEAVAHNEGKAAHYYWYINNQLKDSGKIFTSKFSKPAKIKLVLLASADSCFPDKIIQHFNLKLKKCNLPAPLIEFSPNADGYLDTWIIKNIEEFPNNEVYIYDRWGQKVYEKLGYTNKTAWDGTYKNNTAPASVYYYIIDTGIKDDEEKQIILKGSITLIR